MQITTVFYKLGKIYKAYAKLTGGYSYVRLAWVNDMVFESRSVGETRAFAASFAKSAEPGAVMALYGGLGAGKTAFAQGFCAGLGIEGGAKSPSFGIISEYTGDVPVYHFDLYRIKGERELLDIGGDEYFYKGGFCLVEWAGVCAGLLPEDTISIYIDRDMAKGEDYRLIRIEGGHGVS